MKIKFFALLLIFFSFFGGVFGSAFFLSLAPVTLNNVIKQNTTVKKIDITDLQNTITELVKEVSPSVVSIVIKKDLVLYRSDIFGFFQEPVGSVQQAIGGGTGFFVSKDGKIITNKHVISDPNAEYIVITNDGKEYPAKILATDPLNDIAIVKIDSPGTEFVPLNFAPEENTHHIGEFVIAIGNALAEFQNSVSFGIISGENRSISEGDISLSGLIQTDAAINPGNSGGPLINIDKKVVGMNTAIVKGAEGVGFAIGLTQKKIDYILASIEKYGEIKRPFIGIYYTLITPENAKELKLNTEYGALIGGEKSGIVENSAAQKAGLKDGDIILSIDGVKIDARNNLNTQIQNKIPGDTLRLEVMKKDGTIKILSLTLLEE